MIGEKPLELSWHSLNNGAVEVKGRSIKDIQLKNKKALYDLKWRSQKSTQDISNAF